MAKRITRTAINKALEAAGFEPGTEIVRGNGYWYFSGGDAHTWYSTSVYTYHLSDLSIEEWVAEATEKRGSVQRGFAPRCPTPVTL